MGVIPDAFRSSSSLGMYATAALGSIIAWQISTIIYNLFFHPLRDYPGPLIHRASNLPFAIQHSFGIQAFVTQKLHDKYGPIVRIGPGHLSYTDVRAWKDIYGHHVGAKSNAPEFPKTTTFNQSIRSVPTSILNADREEHSMFRRALSHGFSDSAMREQEPIIVKYVDLLLKQLHRESGEGKKKMNIEAWYNFTTFDVVGSLVFGTSFKCLEGVDYHPWIEFILQSIRLGAVTVSLNYVGLAIVVQWLFTFSQLTIGKVQKYTNDMVQSRLDVKEEREDLFEGIVKRREEWNLSFEKMASNAFILVLAGSETTATLLSGVTYLLLTHPEFHEKLKQEVRSSFSSSDEITMNSVGKLTYMLAVLNEGLRLYPPVTSTLVRQVTPGGGQICDRFVPGGTYVEVQHWSINHSKENWADPWDFDPGRFLKSHEEALEGGNRLEALQSFNVGPRNCIGRNLAYAEMRLILARIIYDFDLRIDDDSHDWIRRQKAFALWERIPLHVYMTPVEKGLKP